MIVEIDPASEYRFHINANTFWSWSAEVRECVIFWRTISLDIPIFPKENDTIEIGLKGQHMIALSEMVEL
jgi:hypothetical protein